MPSVLDKKAAKLQFSVPIRTYGALNERIHWSVRAKRVKAERRATAQCWMVAYSILKLRQEKLPEPPLVVLLTRVGPRTMDCDNLAGSCKAVRDQLAQELGIDDGDSRIRWLYEQRQAKGYAVEVEIAKLEHPT
jgi:hypothetical protein